VSKVSDWLKAVELSQYISAFKAREINGSAFRLLDDISLAELIPSLVDRARFIYSRDSLLRADETIT
jgi:hypothetical protein